MLRFAPEGLAGELINKMPQEFPTLSSPPIKEAILQFWVTPGDTYSSDFLKHFIDLETSRYPTSLAQRETLIQFMSGVDGQQAGVTDKGVNSYKISSADGLDIVQVFKDRLVVSRLEPYKSWGELLDEARRVWGVYQEVVKPSKITGVSVRYINHFILPPSMESFEEYLDSTPNIPENLPQGLASFYVNYQLPEPDSGAVANVRLLFEGAKYEKGSKDPLIPIVLDTDIKMKSEIEIEDDESIISSFDQLHDFKNVIFFSTVKEKTLEMFR